MVEGVPLTYPVNALVSYHYFKNVDIAELTGWGLRLIGDSGAYSAFTLGQEITNDELWGWVSQWREHFVWAAALDVVGDPEKSWDNWRNAPPELGLVPTVHYGEPPSTLDRYVDQGVDFLGLGGMVPFKSEPERQLRWALAVMRYAKQNFPQVRFHGWGVTHPRMLLLPWWSVDSSGFGASYRYGRLVLFDPDTQDRLTLVMDGKQPAGAADLLRRHYGVSWREVSTAGVHNRPLLVQVAMRSMQLLEDHLRRRNRVTPPASLVERYSNNGTQLHFADAGYHIFRAGTQVHAAHSTSRKDWAPLAISH